MPTSPTDRQAGFTLLELLAVLAVLGLAGAAVLRLGQGSAQAANVRSFLIHAEAMMRQARTSAIGTMTEQEVVIDTKARRIIHVDRGVVLDVPEGLSLDGKLARVTDVERNHFVIRFFPTGGSTGANLPFRFRGEVYELHVNWLTGLADVRRG